MSLHDEMIMMAKEARKASLELARISTKAKNIVLVKMARALIQKRAYLIRENQKDLAAARQKGYSKALVDRLILGDKQIREMANCLLATAKLKDPVGEVIKSFRRPNGLFIKKIRVPIGVIGIIYEARPNVTSDCIGLCLKSGNAAILKGGREAIYSNTAIFVILKSVLRDSTIPPASIQLVTSLEHKAIDDFLNQDRYIDVIITRGGEGLIKSVAAKSKIPVIKHYKGICHTFVSDKADLQIARKICFNAKVQKPGVCNAMEAMLVHKAIAKRFLPVMIADFKKAGVEIRGCDQTRRIIREGVKTAQVKDWDTEYLDLILSVKVVGSLKEAINHINTHGSHHSDTIVTKNKNEAEQFLKSVDSACLYVNASTRFTDGYQFGFGAEIGISTDKLHARGPMALEELTTYKYLVYGRGQIRQ